MAFLHFDRNYAPCSVLIVKDGGDPYNDADTVLVQGDDDMKAVAETLGWKEEGLHYGRDWEDFLRERDGEGILTEMSAGILNEYLPESAD